MKIMWVDKRVEATVEFPRGLVFPCLRSIRFQNEDVRFVGPVHIDQTPTALLYRACDGRNEYTVRFESAQQLWVLEAVRDAAASC
jgi:hypothetical protein